MTKWSRTAAAVVLIASALTLPQNTSAEEAQLTSSGTASWYGAKFDGKRTANGERFNKNEFTAAHRTLPFGTRVRVTNKRNGRSVVVRINDRGPFNHRRVIDLSRAAAAQIGMIDAGTAKVVIEKLG